ncbi:MAG: hypothetical protein GXO27_01800 [Chlorobi bacterium]|nr:hypothetical protein [Chlorobiota bacterium]
MKAALRISLLVFLALRLGGCGGTKQATGHTSGRTSSLPPRITDSLFARYTQSVFGDRDTASLRGIRYDGLVVHNGRKLPFSYYHHYGNQFITSAVYAGRTVHPLIYAPPLKRKWTGTAYMPLSAAEEEVVREALPRDWYFYPFYLHASGEPFILEGTNRTLNGNPVTVLIHKKGSKKRYFYFDHKHHFPVKISQFTGDRHDFDIEFMDFRPVEGVYLAHYWIIRLPAHDMQFKLIWKHIDLNPAAPPELHISEQFKNPK